MSGRVTALLVIQLVHFPGGQFGLSAALWAVRSLGRERTTELPNYFNYLKCTSTKSVGKKFSQTGAPKTANELRRAELGQPKLGCAIERPVVARRFPSADGDSAGT